MTNLTVAEVYAIGLPIIYGMIALEAIFSSLTNKSFYRLDDTLCTAGLLIGNILVGSAAKGLSLVLTRHLQHLPWKREINSPWGPKNCYPGSQGPLGPGGRCKN